MRLAPLCLLLLAAACETSDAPGAAASAPAAVAPADTLGLPAPLAERLRAAGVEARALDREGDVYALAEVATDSGAVLLQWADLRAVAVRQILGAQVEGGDAASHFHPNAPSPAFRTRVPAEAVRQSGAEALAVVNAAFFETPGRPSTQIAFPLARGGAVVTGGSSPYGPGRPGAEAARWGRPLRALGLGDTVAHVAAYDSRTGAPLDQAAFAEAVVSYAPDAHPSRIATRFHVLGPLDADGDGTTETLVLATSDGQTTIRAPASLLARLGVAPGAQVALDGGASVFVWNRRAGTLHAPAPAGGHDPQPLPHYLALHLRQP